MKVICIDKGSYFLTLDKIYDAEIISDTSSVFWYQVINDIGICHGVEKELFRPLSDIREEKLNEIFK